MRSLPEVSHRARYARTCAFTAIAAGLSIASAAQETPSPANSVTQATADFAPDDPPGEWHRASRDYANTRYSPLSQITTDNVDRLHVAWSFSDGEKGGHEAAPLVVGGTMYLVTPFPNIAYALDLSKPGAPIKWAYTPNPTPLAQGKACCDVVNRGAVYADGKIIYNLLDAHTVALDAQTGKELWRTKLGNVELGETITMAPLVVRNKVYIGNSGGEMGVAGWLAALDINSGKELWRAYSVGPDDMVRIDEDFKPFYSWMQGKDLGVTTWPADAWKVGGGAVWAWISYDPETNLIYYGTSNPGPRVPTQRPGLNLWTAAIFARDADTGMAKWAYQFTPHDQWDYDGVNENVLIDLPIDGEIRKVLVHLDRNGFGYTIDRLTGEVLVAKPFGHQNWSSGVDLKTGKPNVVAAMQPKPNVKLREVCPPDIGVKDWQPSAFSPRTGLIYTGVFNICMDLTNHPVAYIAGTPYDGMEMARFAGPGGHWGGFIAWDPVKGEKVWEIDEPYMVMSGTLATASDLLFYGTVDGWFRAVNARNGEILWSHKLGSGVIGQPVTYLGPDGRQYVAIYSGVGGAAVVSAGAFPSYPARGSTLYVFSLDGESVGAQPMTAQSEGARQTRKGDRQ
jgi:alcohol dehydrogenase (cytochrome c)